LPELARTTERDDAPQDNDRSAEPASSTAGGIERRRHPRVRVDPGGAETVAGALQSVERRQGDRRQGERRGAGGLRDNVGWTVAADSQAGSKPALRLRKSRIYVLGIAVIAGGIAAYMASQIGRPHAPPVAVAAPATITRVLVAGKAIAAGERLSPAALTWQPWPTEALSSDFITDTATPNAVNAMSGEVARIELLPGDPIRQEKLVRGDGGFLSATLDRGLRGVSIVVNAESASGGFVSPNDHVDVVLTRTSRGADLGGNVSRSQTILHDVRVLAINARGSAPAGGSRAASAPRDEAFAGEAIATLALDPADADLVISASAIGKLSLLLRSGGDAPADADAARRDSINQAIRMSSQFWSE
jgi:pilus assembly protein CpaB